MRWSCLQWGVFRSWDLCGGTLPRLRLFPRKLEDRGELAGRAVAAAEGRPPGRTEAAAGARWEEPQLVEGLDRCRSRRPIPTVVDLDRDADPLAPDEHTVERFRALLHHQVGRRLHHRGVVTLAPTDHVGLRLHRV